MSVLFSKNPIYFPNESLAVLVWQSSRVGDIVVLAALNVVGNTFADELPVLMLTIADDRRQIRAKQQAALAWKGESLAVFRHVSKLRRYPAVIRKTSAADDGTALSRVSFSAILLKSGRVGRARARKRGLFAPRYRRASLPDGRRSRCSASVVEIIVGRDKNRRADKATGAEKESARDDDDDDEDDEDDAGEDGEIISRAKESTMPARYCIRIVLICATGVKPRWTKLARNRNRRGRN